MKSIMRFLGGFLAVVILSAAFTACSDDDDNGSANVGLGIKVFFPTKVVTGQPMTINGSGFGDVTEIEFPGGVKATNFEIVGSDMIRLTAPSGIAAEGGNITVRTANEEATSRLPLTLGKTSVTGFSKQAGEKAQGGDMITVYGKDLEFINKVELLDKEGNPQMVADKDFYRKGTSNLVFYVPQNIYTGTFVGKLHTYDGQQISMPELAYEPAPTGHWEITKKTIWKNDGSLGAISWGGDYRFAPESNSTGEECYTVPQDIWDNVIKGGTFYLVIKGDASAQMRITTGWWTSNWTGGDIMGNNERVTDNGDGTLTLEIQLAGDPILDILDAQHLLLTGDKYTPIEIYEAEKVWVDNNAGPQEIVIWENDGSLGAISWGGDYRFAPESNSTGEECYTVPQDIWDNVIKGGTFYLVIKGDASAQMRITTGWWTSNWTGGDIMGNNERVTDNGDGTLTLEIKLDGDPILDILDAQHLLLTGDKYTPIKLYYKK